MVDLDNECCIGCGACADLCPDVFEMDDRSGKARIIIFDVTDRSCIEEAIVTCPVECISWKDQVI
jgi:ferredoxin